MAHCLLQLSDPHLVAAPSGTMMNVPLRECLRHVVEDAQQHEPDRVLVTGDLSHDGSPASYAALGDELAPLDAPCHGLPGNHDDKSTLADALRNRPFRSDQAVTANGWRLLLLDSAVPDADHGRLSPSALEALDDTLSAYPSRPTLVSLHHSPVPVGVDWLDPINLHAPDDFRAVLERHEQVRLVLFGHVHQAVEAQWGSIDLLGCPSTCFQFTPETDSFAIDSCPPGYRTVMLRADGSFDSTLHRVPVPFRADPTADGY